MIRSDQGGREENESFRSAEEESYQTGVDKYADYAFCYTFIRVKNDVIDVWSYNSGFKLN